MRGRAAVTMQWEDLVAVLKIRARRRLGERALVVSWFDRDLVLSSSSRGVVELVTFEVFLGRADQAPGNLLERGGTLTFGAPVLVGNRWLLRATVPLDGLDAVTCEALANSLAASATALAWSPPERLAAVDLFGHSM